MASTPKRRRANTKGDSIIFSAEGLAKSLEALRLEAEFGFVTNPNLDPFSIVLQDGCEEADNFHYPDDSQLEQSTGITYKEHTFKDQHSSLFIETPPGREPLPKPSNILHPSAPKYFKRTSFEIVSSKRLDINVKAGVNYIIGQIALHWPCGDEEAVREANLSLVTGYSFYHEQFKSYLERLKSLELRGQTYAPFNIQASGKYGFVDLWNKLERKETKVPALEQQALMNQFLSMFLQFVSAWTSEPKPKPQAKYAQIGIIPNELIRAVKASLAEWQEISVAEHLGETAFRSAEWIPFDEVSKEEATFMKNKIIVESTDIFQLGIREKAFKPENVIVVDRKWHRVQKPTDGKPKVVILWARDNPEDITPTEEKIFGAAVYNVKELTQFASEHTQELVTLEMKALMNDIRSHENLKRSMLNVGTLVKSTLGKQTINGVLIQKDVEIPVLGPNARAITVDKVGVLSSLRISIQQARPVLQARNFAFLKGFLPHFAKQQLAKATEASLLNRYGAPDYQSFASYGYSAAMHTDNDDSVTVGWISARSNKVLDDESNFVYAQFKVILDLDVDTTFIWNAPCHLHGTTMNRVFANNPKSWKTFARSLANAPLAQWSRANVLTHNAVSSGKK